MKSVLLSASLVAAVLIVGVVASGCEPEPVEPVYKCEYNGKTYYAGDSFKAADGCNTCSCVEGKGVLCTLMMCPVPICEYDGMIYKQGQSFPSTDKCNTCFCGENGMVGCTKMKCLPKTCDYNGKTYNAGDTFASIDDCNQCSCGTDGNVACTEKACICNPDKEWNREYVSKDAEQCKLIKFFCPENTTYFGNACGCGCEQSASCPEWFNCMPPAACDVDKIKAECPYSGIAW